MKSWMKYLEEKKDHLIKKVPSLTEDEKQTVITFFNKHNSLEKMIDWNNLKNLTMLDFQKVIDSQQALKISKGLAQLGKDYVELDSLDKVNKAFMPLTWEGAKYLASNKINKEEGKWCIAYRESDNYWKTYSPDYFFIIYVTPTNKFALQYHKTTFKSELLWDKYDNRINISHAKSLSIPMNKLILKNKSIIMKNIDKLSTSIFNEDFMGDIRVDAKRLTSLKGCPKKVKGNFICSENKLTSLEGAPEIIGGYFNCSYNYLTSLKGCPKEVGGSFICDANTNQFTEEEIRAICDIKGNVIV